MIMAHIADLALQRIDHGVVEVDPFELLRAAQSARAEDVDLHQLVAEDIQTNLEHAVQ